MAKINMKRIGHIFEMIVSFENLYAAFKKAYAASGRTPAACRFYFHLETELLRLQQALSDSTYRPSPYRYFTVCDPKQRVISVAPFADRVVHHALVTVFEPIFEPTFIFDSYATRKGKGTHRAVLRAQVFLRSNPCYLKLDINRYFDSIDHRVLMSLIRRKVKDSDALDLTEKIIANSDTSRGLAAGKGLPIGNLTSQFFANVYLNPLDHFIKETLGVKHYIRYMDDMVFFGTDRSVLKVILASVKAYLMENLALSLNSRATLINTRQHGLPFLGFRIFPNLMRIKRQNLDRSLAHYREHLAAYQKGSISEDRLADCVRSIMDHVSFADSLWLRRDVMNLGGRRQAAPTG